MNFNLTLANQGKPIQLDNGDPVELVAYVPQANEYQRVLVVYRGLVLSFNENGEPRSDQTMRLEMAPTTVLSKSVPFPKAQTMPLEIGIRYWVPCVHPGNTCTTHIWCDDTTDDWFLANGLVHLTPQDARAHANAIVEAFRP